MIYLIFLCFPEWNKLHDELLFLKDIVLKSSYPVPFIDKYFETFLNKTYINSPQILIVKKKDLNLVIVFIGKLPFQTRTKIN